MLESYGSVVFGLLAGVLVFSIAWIGQVKEASPGTNSQGSGFLGLVSYMLGLITLLASIVLLFCLDFFPTIGN